VHAALPPHHRIGDGIGGLGIGLARRSMIRFS